MKAKQGHESTQRFKKDERIIPSALDRFDDLKSKVQENQVLFCFDYDGTLTPIVEDYEKAFFPEDMRDVLKQVASKMPVAVVSGRDIKFIQKHVNLSEVYFAGSHGFEIEGPEGYAYEVEEGKQLLPVLDAVEQRLRDDFAKTEGVEVERKKYAIAVHYRQVPEESIAEVEEIVARVLGDNPKVKKGEGKKVMEIKPNIDWHKGKAVETLASKLSNKAGDSCMAFYIGDDITDEDAFAALKDGCGILVGSHGDQTYADYRLESVAEVKELLERFLAE